MFWRQRRTDADFSDEIRAHIEHEAERLVAEGMSADDARTEARRRFGNLRSSRERFYESRRVAWIDSTLQDIRYAVRNLRRAPSFTAIVVLTFALGIGVNTAIFAAINGFFLRPLGGVSGPESLVVVASDDGQGPLARVSYADHVDLRDGVTALDGISGLQIDFLGMSDGGRAESLLVAFTTSNYFDMLGVAPVAGRLYRTGEGDADGEAPLVVLGHRFWQRRFGGDPDAVGRTVRLNTVPYTIAGVVSKDFRGTYPVLDFDAYVPLGQRAVHYGTSAFRESRDNRNLHTVAKLRRGVTLAEARAEVDRVSRALAAEYPEENRGVSLRLIPEGLARPEPSMLGEETSSLAITLFLGLSGAVLLVACLNVVNLLLVRSSARRAELAVRMALGAGRRRIARQLVTESLILAGLGALMGGAIGGAAASALGSLPISGSMPIVIDTSLDLRVYAYVAAITVAAGVLVAVWPVMGLGRLGDWALHTGVRSHQASPARAQARGALVIGQIAMSSVLLVAAGLLVRSLGEAERLDLGYEPEGLVNFTMDPLQVGYRGDRAAAFRDELLRRVRALPAIESASIAQFVPHGFAWASVRVWVEGSEAPGPLPLLAGVNAVSEDYFETLGIPILAGRALVETDNEEALPAAVISETMASRLWEGSNALGRRFSMDSADGPWIEVVGISRDALFGLLPVDGPQNFFFLPSRQRLVSGILSLQVRTALEEPMSVVPVIERQIAALEPDLPLLEVAAQEDMLLNANGILLLRIAAVFAAVPGLIGLFLAGIGLYGVLAYSVTERTPEMGIRIALGARRNEILGLVFRQAVILLGAGLGIGLAAALGMTRLFQPILIPDAMTFIAVSLVLSTAVFAASWIPARRATRVDPMMALRHE